MLFKKASRFLFWGLLEQGSSGIILRGAEYNSFKGGNSGRTKSEKGTVSKALER